MLNTLLLGAAGSILAVLIIWMARRCYTLFCSAFRFMRSTPTTVSEAIETAQKQKSRASAYAYADQLLRDIRYTSLVNLMYAAVFCIVSHDFGSWVNASFASVMRVFTAWASIAMVVYSSVLFIAGQRLADVVRNLRADDVGDEK